MTSLPLHPGLVHIPLGLAFVLPAIAIAFAWALWTGRLKTRFWLTVVLLLATLLGAGLVAMKTGQHEEERVETVVPEAAIAKHEALAEQFLWLSGISLAAATVVLVLHRPAAIRAATSVTVLGTFLIAGAAIRVGHAGGQLVYEHNAAAAYASEKNAVMEGKQTGDRTTSPSSRTGGDDDDAQ